MSAVHCHPRTRGVHESMLAARAGGAAPPDEAAERARAEVELGRFLQAACGVVEAAFAVACAGADGEGRQVALTPGEREVLARFTSPARRLQWLAGRRAAKLAVARYTRGRGRRLSPELDVLPGPGGQPHVVQHPDLHLSITHSGPFAIACVAGQPIGVDLEEVFDPHPSLLARYYHPRERAVLAGERSRERRCRQATLFWTCKEAVSKALHLGMRMDFASLDTSEAASEEAASVEVPRRSGLRLLSRRVGRFGASMAWGRPCRT